MELCYGTQFYMPSMVLGTFINFLIFSSKPLYEAEFILQFHCKKQMAEVKYEDHGHPLCLDAEPGFTPGLSMCNQTLCSLPLHFIFGYKFGSNGRLLF